MAHCARKEITRVKVVSTRGRANLRGGPRYCVVAFVEPRRKDIRTKGGGKLVDGGKRMAGCYMSAKKAAAVQRKWEAKSGVC